MCGICLVLHPKRSGCSDDWGRHIRTTALCCGSSIYNRGPDAQGVLEVDLNEEFSGLFGGTTLHFRGNLTVQPLKDDAGNILLWNGEIFQGIQVKPEENDGYVLLRMLGSFSDEKDIAGLMSKIRGPWAFIYWQETQKRLWFGRDIFGRRSLLCNTSTNKDGQMITLASLKTDHESQSWVEVPAFGLYYGDFSSNSKDIEKLTLLPWALPIGNSEDSVIIMKEAVIFNNSECRKCENLNKIPIQLGAFCVVSNLKPFNIEIPTSDIAKRCESLSATLQEAVIDARVLKSLATSEEEELAERLLLFLGEAVKTRIECQAQVCHLCMSHLVATQKADATKDKVIPGQGAKHLPPIISNSGKHTHAQCSYGDCQEKKKSSSYIASELHSCNTNMELLPEMENTCANPGPTASSKQLTITDEPCGHARVAVLFSGGIDSLVIAALADRYVAKSEPIDLLNVAFEQQQQIQQPQSARQRGAGCARPRRDPYCAPDRDTGREGLEQLKTIAPHRKWNFVEINVPLQELQEVRANRVKDLVHPLNTVLDDSIGCAIWFAARGKGKILPGSNEGEAVPYTTTARVVLVGMGADEQFAGYSRHRVKFNCGGWQALVEEIHMEIERISSRNLGRDDRVISDHARESRFPFLDENLVSFLNGLPIWLKTNLHFPRGIGEKFLLRLAATKLGLTAGAVLPKRAIQFGSRIAKAENRKEKASDKCERLN